MKQFGLIGFPLSHSFSKRYFSEKFDRETISDAVYNNFEIPTITEFPTIVQQTENLRGLNVTIPYKQEVMKYMDNLDNSAEFVGAVNVIKVGIDKKLTGYNSDYYGFMESLKLFLPNNRINIKALILGTGGAAKAVEAALKTMNIEYKYVSRNGTDSILSYEQLTVSVLEEHELIINTTPIGMYPNTDACPNLNYEAINGSHYLFDLIYNPETTLFMKKGALNGANVKNGLEMLHLQAEKAWEIWNQ
jgi:shikimate dehydrogenase